MKRLDDPGSRQTIGGFVNGMPDWLGPAFRYCSRCGSALVHGQVTGEDRSRHHCPECGFISYVNPRIVVSALPITEAGELVLLRRGIVPGYGAWAQPGGYLEADETAIQGAIRETREETRLDIEISDIVGIYSRPHAGVVVVAYRARIVGGTMSPTPEALEVRPFKVEEIPWSELAFNTTLWAVRDWVRSVRPELDVDTLGDESFDR